METVTMQTRNLAFLLSEGPRRISRAQATIPSGTGVVAAGTAIGELTATAGSFVPSPNAETVGVEGAEVVTAILPYGRLAGICCEPQEIAEDISGREATSTSQSRQKARIGQKKNNGIAGRSQSTLELGFCLGCADRRSPFPYSDSRG